MFRRLQRVPPTDCEEKKAAIIEANEKIWRLKESQEREMILLREEISRLSQLKQTAELKASDLEEKLLEEQKRARALSWLFDEQEKVVHEWEGLSGELEKTRGELSRANQTIAHLQSENGRLLERIERLQLNPLPDGLPEVAGATEAQLTYLIQRIRLAYPPLYQAIQEIKRWRLPTNSETKLKSKDPTLESQ